MDVLHNKSNPFHLSFLAAACLVANISAYGGRTHGYTGRKKLSTKSHLNHTHKQKQIALAVHLKPVKLPMVSHVASPIKSSADISLWQQLTPRAFLDGTLSSQGFLYGDAMAPVAGNPEGFVFLDGVGKGGTDKGWLGGLGTGIRKVWRGAIFGGYVFGEYDRTALGNNFWTLNPGLELLFTHWDFRVNGYFPLGSRESTNAVLFGSQLGITCPTFKGHQQFDQVFNDANVVAPGLDASVGYIIPQTKRSRVFVGGYYYFFDHASDLRGVVGGVELPLTQRISLLFRDSYDNVNKNTAVFTLRAYFGGTIKVDENDIHERLLDPIERDVGVLYTGSGIPTQQVLYNTGELKLQRDNIWFFKPGANVSAINANACTYENPCSSVQFVQPTINAINNIAPLANFYLADGGDYFISSLVVNSGQSIYGRTADFCQIAPGTTPVLFGSLTLQGNNYLQAFRLVNQFATPGLVGITAVNAPNITIDKVYVGPDLIMAPFAPIPAGSFKTGVLLDNAKNVLINNSVINAASNTNGINPFTNGITARNNSTFTLQNSTVNAHFSLVSNQIVTTTRSLAAIYLHNNNKANLYSNTVNVVGDASTSMAIDPYTPTITLQAAQISIVNDMQPGISELVATNNKLSLMTGISQQNANGLVALGNSRALSIYNNSGTVQANMANNYFRISNTALLVGSVRDTYIAGIFAQANYQSHTAINSTNNRFDIVSTVTSTSGDANSSSHRAIDLRVVGGYSPTITLNSRNDVFNVMSNADGARDAISYGHFGIHAEKFTGSGFGSNITVNTQGDTFNLISNAFARNGLAFGVAYGGIYIHSGGNQSAPVITVNSTGDTFNVSSNVISPNGTAIAGLDWAIYNGAPVLNSRLTVNASGDTFNMRVNAQGAIVNVLTTYGARAAFPGATINLTNGNVFRFFVRGNGIPGPVVPKLALFGATINDDGTNKFLIY